MEFPADEASEETSSPFLGRLCGVVGGLRSLINKYYTVSQSLRRMQEAMMSLN